MKNGKLSRAPRDYTPSSSHIITYTQQQQRRGKKRLNGTPSDDEIVSDSINGFVVSFRMLVLYFFAFRERFPRMTKKSSSNIKNLKRLLARPHNDLFRTSSCSINVY